MRVSDLIERKRDGGELAEEEIRYFVCGFTDGTIPDYQAAAFLMAVYFRGMSDAETAVLTDAMARSGETLDFSGLGRPVADKHSTGGVGDKATLVLLPLVAAAGVTMAKMSGRGLGHTGGTIDKLSCIPGFQTSLSREQFYTQVRDTGMAIMGQSPQMTPADGKLYALRDVTATVESIPLIASSVMSKKIAAGAIAIVLDVKTGSGAFMRDGERARELARVMVSIGKALGRRTTALITSMEQPLGNAVGNHLEVVEAIHTLAGYGPADLTELCLELGAEILLAAGLTSEREAALEKVADCLRDGRAMDAFRRFVTAQGGDPSVADMPDKLGSPPHQRTLLAPSEGYITRLDARTVGMASVLSGAGREKKGDDIDLLAGIYLHKKIGDAAVRGEILAEVCGQDPVKLEAAIQKLSAAYSIGPVPPAVPPLILDRIT